MFSSPSWVNILPRNPYNAISTFFENLIFLTTPAPLFSGKCNKKPNTRPFFEHFQEKSFFPLKSPKKFTKSAKKQEKKLKNPLKNNKKKIKSVMVIANNCNCNCNDCSIVVILAHFYCHIFANHGKISQTKFLLKEEFPRRET